jgi:hypothetical protein
MKNALLTAILIFSCIQTFAQNITFDVQSLRKNYCTSFATNSKYEWIQSVAIGRTGNTSGNNNGYGNFTNVLMHVQTDKAYFLHLTSGRLSNGYAEHWTVYIDYNNDGDFDEANEIIAKGVTDNSDSAKICFVIPAYAKICTTQMRVQMAYATTVTDPCAFYEFGEVEDYSVKISCGSRTHDTGNYAPVILNVFPNPVKGSSVTVSMQLQKQSKIVFKVSDLSGNLLLMQSFTGIVHGKNVFTINNVEKLNRGVFMLTAEQKGKIIGRTQLILE